MLPAARTETGSYVAVPSSDKSDKESSSEDLSNQEDAEESWVSRLCIVLTIPHLVAFISFLILVVNVALTLRSEQARQLRSEDLARRCAFVYVVPSNHTDVDNLGFSLQSLNKYFKVGMNYQILIVHEDIPPVVQGRLQALSEASLHFRQFLLQRPADFNSSKQEETLIDQAKTRTQHKNRFWFYTAMLAEPSKSMLSDIDYLVRLESDSAFTGEIADDFLKEFVLSGMQYGHQGIEQECNENVTYTLRHLAESYVDLNGISPRSAHLWNSLVSKQSGDCAPTFQNNFEVINMRFFRSHSGIQDWIKVVETNGGMYTYGWGDAMLRYVTVALYAAPEKLVTYGPKSIPYSRTKKHSI